MPTPATDANAGLGAQAKGVAEHASSLVRLELELAREPAVGAEPLDHRVRAAVEVAAVADAADADVQEVTLREVPAVSAEVGLGEQLRLAVPRGELSQAVGADPGLALARHHHVLVVGDLAERSRDRTVMAARADHERADAEACKGDRGGESGGAGSDDDHGWCGGRGHVQILRKFHRTVCLSMDSVSFIGLSVK